MKKSLSHCELPIYGLVQLMKITPVLCLLCPYIISLHELDEKSRICPGDLLLISASIGWFYRPFFVTLSKTSSINIQKYQL